MIKYDLISNFSECYPAKLALIDDSGSLSWQTYKEQVGRGINRVLSEKITLANPIIFISKNTKELAVLASIFSTLGVPFQGIDYNLHEDTLTVLLAQLNVEVIFIAKEYEENFNRLKDKAVFHQIEDFFNKLPTHSLVNVQTLENIEKRIFRSYAFTSGTTGIPKIVYRTTSFDKRRFDYLENRYQFNQNDIHLVSLPMYHVSSTGWLRLFLSLGCTCVIHNFMDGYQLCEILNNHNISTTIISPVMLKELTDEIDVGVKMQYFSSLRYIVTGGKNLSSSLKCRAIQKLGPIVYEYYGTTETGVNTLLDPQEALAHPGSVGQIFAGNKILILDQNNKPLPYESIGRIAIHSYMNMDQYLNAETASIVVDNEVYLLTTDYGYMSCNGYLYLTQRVSDDKETHHDFYGVENDILNLGYIEDVFIRNAQDELVEINVVPRKYYPYKKMVSEFQQISNSHGINQISVKVINKLDYTLTGKIKLTLKNAA